MLQDRNYSSPPGVIVESGYPPPVIQGGMFSQMALSNTNEIVVQLCREMRTYDRYVRSVERIKISIRIWEK